MKFTETFFKFPIRLYRSNDVEESQEISWTGDEVRYKIATAKIASVDDILNIEEYYSLGLSHEEIIGNGANGFACSVLETRNKEYICHWSLKKLEEELNKFVEKLDLESALRAEIEESQAIIRLTEKLREQGITVIDKEQLHDNHSKD